MIVEQIRYFTTQVDRDTVLTARRAVNRVRASLGIPPGHTLLADADPDEGPTLIWQCVYEDEGQLAAAEGALMGDETYEAARSTLSRLAVRVELELYVSDEEEEGADSAT